MKHTENTQLKISAQIVEGLALGLPVVALESTVITHGLPYPDNVKLALDMETTLRSRGVLPATIAVINGVIRVGLSADEIEQLGRAKNAHKISVRDLAPACVAKWTGGTTVAGTLAVAQRARIQVFATGGIGGVHRNAPFDISADLPQLARTPLLVVCAGAKSILDLPATLEYLETVGVPVVGFQTDDFPAFFSRSSGLPTSARADSPAEIARLAKWHWELGFESAVLVANPPPAEHALDYQQVDAAIQTALQEAARLKIRGQAVTPFLLQKVNILTGGESLQANLGLLLNNARLAAEIARQLPTLETR